MSCSIVAHRGFAAAYSENSLTAVRECERLRVDAIELDVRVTRDGVPVLMHDASPRRTALQRTSVPIAQLPHVVVRQLDVGDGNPPPTLRRALDETSVPLVLDIKGTSVDAARRIVETVGSAHARCWFQSNRWPVLACAPSNRRMLLVETPWYRRWLSRSPTLTSRHVERRAAHSLRQLAGAHGDSGETFAMNVCYNDWSACAHQSLLRVGRTDHGLAHASTWTVNDRETTMAAFRCGFDAVVSDRPEALHWRDACEHDDASAEESEMEEEDENNV